MIRVEGTVIVPRAVENQYEERRHRYASPNGLERIETRSVTNESDYATGMWERRSLDNGRTWGEWINVYADSFHRRGDNEVMNILFTPSEWNPVHKHYVGCAMERVFIGNHRDAYARYWGKGENSFKDHCYVVVAPDLETPPTRQLVRYEQSGNDFDPANPNDPDYLDRNQAYFGSVTILSDGDIAFAVGAQVTACCRVLGIDPAEIFPSCHDIMGGLVIVRGTWNPASQQYDLRYSKPVLLSDLQSSRGVEEPTLAELNNGRLLVVFRGSNEVYPNWNSRISPHAPGYKWFTLSDDGGRTFHRIMPWHFDSREVCYASGTYSLFVRADKNGRLYWIGNLTDPVQTNGNDPRWPLVIAEVDPDHGTLIKSTLTIIDTRRPGESEKVQLSNFDVFQDRETGLIEVRLAKLCQTVNPDQFEWRCETWLYKIDVGE